MIRISTRPTRNKWLESLYRSDLVRADDYTRLLADKLFFGRELEKALGERSFLYYPKTRGLRELVRQGGPLREILAREFPNGFIVKPVGEVNSGGETPGFYFDAEKFLRQFERLARIQPSEYTPELRLLASAIDDSQWASPDLGAVTTGERLLVQSDLGVELAGRASSKSREFDEVRIHTFERTAIRGGDFHRWAVSPVQVREKFGWAIDFTNRFLAELPREMIERQAWSLDLFVVGPDQIRILDVNTNRGRESHWSGFLSNPALLGAYTRHIEASKSVRFEGFNGFLLRNGLASYHKYWKKKYIEGIR